MLLDAFWLQQHAVPAEEQPWRQGAAGLPAFGVPVVADWDVIPGEPEIDWGAAPST